MPTYLPFSFSISFFISISFFFFTAATALVGIDHKKSVLVLLENNTGFAGSILPLGI